MSYAIPEDLGAPATNEELAAAEAIKADLMGDAPLRQEPANVVHTLQDRAAEQNQALSKAAFDDFRPALTAETVESRAALALALERHLKASGEAEATRTKRAAAEARREEILNNESLTERQQVDQIARINAETLVHEHRSRAASERAEQTRASLAPLYRHLLAALRQEVTVLHHRRYRLQVDRLSKASGADPDDFEAAKLIEDLAEHRVEVWILWSWRYESQFEVNVSLAQIDQHGQRLLEAAA